MTRLTPEEMEQKWADRGQAEASSFTEHPGWFVAKAIAVLIAISFVFGVIGFAAGWFHTAVKVVSPANVTRQYQLAFEDWNSLQATAGNACVVRNQLATETQGTDAYNQLTEQEIALVANYNRIKSEYEARMQNIFQANKVKPAQLPFEAPTEAAMEGQVC